MRYGTIDQLRAYLPQVAPTVINDDLLETLLERATDIVNLVLQFQFDGYDYVATSRYVMVPYATTLLNLPHYQPGTLTAISLAPPGGQAVSYTENVDYVIETGDAAAHTWLRKLGGSWPAGRYQATAKWGYGEPPPSVVGVTLELAVNLWRGRDRGMFTDGIGVEGSGAIMYQRALTNQQRMILEETRKLYSGVTAV